MSKARSSWKVFGASLAVIRRTPTLLVFPIFTTVAMLAMVGAFGLLSIVEIGGTAARPETWWPTIDHALAHLDRAQDITIPLAFYAECAAVYLVGMFVSTFFNVAFFHEIIASLRGDSVSISRGLRFAVGRLRVIALWTLCSGIIGLAIKAIESRLDVMGRLFMGAVGIAWSLASVFAIPAIVLGDKNETPAGLVRRSAGALERTWGETLIGYVGMELAGGLIGLGSLVFFVAATAASIHFDSFLILGVVFVTWFVALVVLAYLSSAASRIFKAALFLYAAEGTLPPSHDRAMFDGALRTAR